MKKIMVFAAVVLVAVFVIFLLSGKSATSKDGPTIEMLLKYIGSQGLKVEAPKKSTDEEQAVVDKTKQAIVTLQKAYGIKAKKNESDPVERTINLVDGIRVDIKRYKSAEFAKQAWEKLCTTEEKRKERAGIQKSPYFKSTILTEGVFVLGINHYEVKLTEEGGIRPFPLEVKEDYIEKIKGVLASFHPEK